MLTVVFATRNRGPMIPRTLDAFSRVSAPDGGCRLIVVDNGSTDTTESVAQEFSERLPLTLLCCDAPGKNRALNIALGHVDGDLAVFTDDDVLPDRDGLQRVRAAVDAHPEATMFGGTVLRQWPGPVPAWLSEQAVDFGVLFTKNIRPTGACRSTDIFGPNMAVRRHIFDAGTPLCRGSRVPTRRTRCTRWARRRSFCVDSKPEGILPSLKPRPVYDTSSDQSN